MNNTVLTEETNLKIHTMENHDNAYHVWKESGVKQRILVHIDAHHDMWFIREGHYINIANYICRAIEDKIVSEIFWVVPDKTWDSKKNIKPILQYLSKITKTYPGKAVPINIQLDYISTSVYGKSLTVCTLNNLPSLNKYVLLDIDVDYLVIPQVAPYGKSDTYVGLPWCWPNELIKKLDSQNIKTDLITIAYSVEGGYTPLKWKYLGDEVLVRLKNEDTASIKGMELIKSASILAHENNFHEAEKLYLEAKKLLVASPVPDYHLSLLYAKNDKLHKAQKHYKQALLKDPSYKTPYNSFAINYYEDKYLNEAKEEHLKVLNLDPDDPYALIGLAQIALKRKEWKEGEYLVGKALEINQEIPDVYRILGDLLLKQNKIEEAINAYESCLKLLLHGYKSINSLILSATKNSPLTNYDHYYVHSKLAYLRSLKGDITQAINGYKICTTGGSCGFFIYSRLAYLYLKKKKYKEYFREMLEAIKVIPLDLRDYFSDLIISISANFTKPKINLYS